VTQLLPGCTASTTGPHCGQSVRRLVEDVVRYQGSNGVRLNHHVVRDFPGGVDGFPLTGGSDVQEIGVHLAIVLKGLNRYLDNYGSQRPVLDNYARSNSDR